MIHSYPVILTKTGDERDTYLVYIPDLDGATEGYGLYDAVRMAQDYIKCALYSIDEKDYPKPSDLSEVNITKSKFLKPENLQYQLWKLKSFDK